MSINIMHHFYFQVTMRMYLQEKNIIQKNKDLSSQKCYFGLVLNKLKSFKCQVSLLFFVLNKNKLSSHMDQIREKIYSSNHKTHSYDQMIKMIVNLGSKKVEDNNKSSTQLTRLQSLLLMSISNTPEKY